MPPPKPVAGYYRVSVARDGMVAPEMYEEEIRRYCDYKGLKLGAIFKDLEEEPSSVGLLAARCARRARYALAALGAATSTAENAKTERG